MDSSPNLFIVYVIKYVRDARRVKRQGKEKRKRAGKPKERELAKNVSKKVAELGGSRFRKRAA